MDRREAMKTLAAGGAVAVCPLTGISQPAVSDDNSNRALQPNSVEAWINTDSIRLIRRASNFHLDPQKHTEVRLGDQTFWIDEPVECFLKRIAQERYTHSETVSIVGAGYLVPVKIFDI